MKLQASPDSHLLRMKRIKVPHKNKRSKERPPEKLRLGRASMHYVFQATVMHFVRDEGCISAAGAVGVSEVHLLLGDIKKCIQKRSITIRHGLEKSFHNNKNCVDNRECTLQRSLTSAHSQENRFTRITTAEAPKGAHPSRALQVLSMCEDISSLFMSYIPPQNTQRREAFPLWSLWKTVRHIYPRCSSESVIASYSVQTNAHWTEALQPPRLPAKDSQQQATLSCTRGYTLGKSRTAALCVKVRLRCTPERSLLVMSKCDRAFSVAEVHPRVEHFLCSCRIFSWRSHQ